MITNTCISRRSRSPRPYAGRHSWRAASWEAVYRRVRSTPPSPPQPPRVIHNTVHQTVVHLHQTNHQHILNRALFVTALSRGVPMAAAHPAQARPEEDPSRPARAARRLARLLSTESARRVLRPFFREVLHTLLLEGRERWRDRPGRIFLVLWDLMGRRQEGRAMALRYAIHERAAEGLCRLPAVPQDPPAREEPRRAVAAAASQPPPAPPGRPRLSEGEFQALVHGVSAALERRTRLEAMRKGGW